MCRLPFVRFGKACYWLGMFQSLDLLQGLWQKSLSGRTHPFVFITEGLIVVEECSQCCSSYLMEINNCLRSMLPRLNLAPGFTLVGTSHVTKQHLTLHTLHQWHR